MNLLILTALQPHREEEIYLELSAFLPWRLVANSCYAHLITRNHPNLLRFLDFTKCPNWLETILFDKVVEKDDRDASITALHIVMSSRGKSDDPEVHPLRLSKTEAKEAEGMEIPAAFHVSRTDVQLLDSIARDARLLCLTAKWNPGEVLSCMQRLRMGAGALLKPEHMDEAQAKLVAECLTDSLIQNAEVPVTELETMFSDLLCLLEVKVHWHMLTMLEERLRVRKATYTRLAGVLLKELTLPRILPGSSPPFYKHPLLLRLASDHPFLVIMNCKSYYGPVRDLSKAIASEDNEFAVPPSMSIGVVNTWSKERMRTMMQKVDWYHFTKSRAFFTELMTSSAHMWSAVFWFANETLNERLMKALWVFLEEHSERLMSGVDGVYLEGEPRVYLSRSGNSHPTPINFFSLVRRQLRNEFHPRFNSLFLTYFHRSAGKILREPSCQDLGLYLMRQYSQTVGVTFLRVQLEFSGFPGTELVKSQHPMTDSTLAGATSTDLVGVNGNVNYDEVDRVLRAKFNTSLQYLLRPEKALFLGANYQQLAWLGFMMHPLFSRLLPPFLGGDWDAPEKVRVYRFVDLDGVDSRGELTPCVRTDGNLMFFWPMTTFHPEVLLKVSMQIFDTYRLYLKEVMANTYREERMQASFLVAAAQEVKMRHFKSMAYNKTTLVPSEHPLFADGRILSTIDKNFKPQVSPYNRNTPWIELVVAAPRPPGRGRGHSGFVFDLLALESDVIHTIYLHLVRLQLQGRRGVLPCFQAVVPQKWWEEAFQPVYRSKDVNYSAFVTPKPMPRITDAEGRLLHTECTNLVTLGHSFANAVAKQRKPFQGSMWESLTQGVKAGDEVVVDQDLNNSGYVARAFLIKGETAVVIMPTPKILQFLLKI